MDITPLPNPFASNCSFAPPGARFDIAACYNRTVGCSFFPKVPIGLCEEYCGSSYGDYDARDIWGALTTWVIPLFGLVANMHFAESTLHGLGSQWPWMAKILKSRSLRWLRPHFPKHFVFAVQLANPIGTIWSLVDKLDRSQTIWNRCQEINENQLDLGNDERNDGEEDRFANALRDISNVCNALDDFGYDKSDNKTERLIELLGAKILIPSRDGLRSVSAAHSVYKHVKVASRDLAFARIRDSLHVAFAVLVYVGNAAAALLTSSTSNGLDYALPHTIALRELCFFLLAQVILSSAAGRWAQQWMPQVVMRTFAEQILAIEEDIRREDAVEAISAEDAKEFWGDLGKEEIALWDGGSYVFRPQKGNSNHNRRWVLSVMAWLMVAIAFSVSFTTSWLTPTTGIGGRGLAEILYFTVWNVNFFVEQLWMVQQIGEPKKLFFWIWLKDGIISLFVLLFFYLPFIGEPSPAV